MIHILFLVALCTKLSMNTYQKALRMAAVGDRTAGFPLFSSLLSFLQCDRYREKYTRRLDLKYQINHCSKFIRIIINKPTCTQMIKTVV